MAGTRGPRWQVRLLKIATAAVLSFRLFWVGFAVWGISTGRASARALISVGDGLLGIKLAAYSVELLLGIALLTAPDPYSKRFQFSLATLAAMLTFGPALSAAGWLVWSARLPPPEVPDMALSGVYALLALHTLLLLRKPASAPTM